MYRYMHFIVSLLILTTSQSDAQAQVNSSSGTQAAVAPKPADEKDYSAELPKIAPKSPEDSLKEIKLKTGFHAELVASEPLIRSPMAMDFDEYGRAFVVELPEYNQYASQQPHGKGAVKRLEDSDGDGRYDKAIVVVDNLDYPTAVACWDGGILVGVAPDILFCKDTDGDGRADVRRKLFTGFGQDKAGEGMLNSIRWRIDNRFHISTGLDGGEIVPADLPANEAKKPLGVRGQHLLLDPRNWQPELTSGGGQHGMSLDDWNLHVFVCGNSEPVHSLMYDGRYLARNPYLQAPAAAINIAPEGKFTKLMRISAVEPWRILRTRLRSQGIIPGSDEGGTPSGFFTGATGITLYRGDAWPSEYRGSVFVGEVANNLIYRARLEPNGVGLTAHRADQDAEFLASKDNWFRPVQMANAPDGTLYVLDMYRELIEGAAFLAPQILKHMDTSAGANQGRIYRIAPQGFTFSPPPRLGDLSSVELVKYFEHGNAWHRETASRLIYQRQDRAAIEPLRNLIKSTPLPLAKTMALHSLQGLKALEPEWISELFLSKNSKARQQALRLAEFFSSDINTRHATVRLADDADVAVRYQAAFTLGEFAGEDVVKALTQLAMRDGSDSWMQLAVLSSVGNRRGAFLQSLLARSEARGLPHVRSLVSQLCTQIGAAGDKGDLAILLKQIDGLNSGPDDQKMVNEILRNVVQHPATGQLVSSSSERVKKMIESLLDEARMVSADDSRKVNDRVSAVKTLGSASFESTRQLWSKLLESQQPQPVQTASLEVLSRFDQAEIPSLILAAWSAQTPQIRATAVETLFSRPAWISAFLSAVEQQKVARADLDPARTALLIKHDDPSIRDRAQKLLAGSTLASRQAVVDSYQKALEVKGDIARGREHFRKSCAGCHKLEGFGESTGADLSAIRDRGTAAVLLNILDPNREVKPQFLGYVVLLDTGRTLSGMIAAETANSLTIRKADNTNETILRVNIDQIKSTGLSFMPEGMEKQLDVAAMADLLAYLNSIK